MICAKCHKESPKGSIYCQNCGEKFQLPEQDTPIVGYSLNNNQESVQSDSEKEKRYCKYCGGNISLANGKCESCGKRNTQLSGFPTTVKNAWFVSLIVLVVVLAGLNVFQYMNNTAQVGDLKEQLQDKEDSMNTLRGTIDSRNQEISSLRTENNKQRIKIEFFDRYVFFTMKEAGNYYYSYDQVIEMYGYFKYPFRIYIP